MLNYFEFNGKDSRDMGLLIRDKQTYNQAKRDLSFVSVPGRSGDIIIDNGKYQNVTVQYGVKLFTPYHGESNPNQNLAYGIYDLKNWLIADGVYRRLYDSYDSDYYRLACYNGEMSFDTNDIHVVNTTIEFNCKPYRYRVDGDDTIVVNSDSLTVYNPEMYSSLPKMKIYPRKNGDVLLSVGNSTINLKNVVGYIEIDSETQNAYFGTTNRNLDCSGTFPVLEPGQNTFYFLTNVYRVEVIPRWRAI